MPLTKVYLLKKNKITGSRGKVSSSKHLAHWLKFLPNQWDMGSGKFCFFQNAELPIICDYNSWADNKITPAPALPHPPTTMHIDTGHCSKSNSGVVGMNTAYLYMSTVPTYYFTICVPVSFYWARKWLSERTNETDCQSRQYCSNHNDCPQAISFAKLRKDWELVNSALGAEYRTERQL